MSDFSTTALAHVRSTAEALGADVAERIGHRPIDPATGAEAPAAGQAQVSVEEAVTALESDRWEFSVAEDRPRAAAGTGVDAVICTRRRLR